MIKWIKHKRDNRKSLKRWKKIIQEDRDHDYDFLLVLLEQKLRFMQKYFKDSNEIKSMRIRYEIEEVLSLFDKLNNDPYMSDLRPEFHDTLSEIFKLINKNISGWWGN